MEPDQVGASALQPILYYVHAEEHTGSLGNAVVNTLWNVTLVSSLRNTRARARLGENDTHQWQGKRVRLPR